MIPLTAVVLTSDADGRCYASVRVGSAPGLMFPIGCMEILDAGISRPFKGGRIEVKLVGVDGGLAGVFSVDWIHDFRFGAVETYGDAPAPEGVSA